MLNRPTLAAETLIIGAGPYGLSIAACLREAGIPFRIFGKPMQTWATRMPDGMYLRSDQDRSSMHAGTRSFTIADFRTAGGTPVKDHVRVSEFTAYGQEFARRFVPELETEQIKCVDRRDDHFQVTTSTGERFLTRSVVMAVGLTHQEHVPEQFRHLPSTRVTHTSQHVSYSPFVGREVTVLGSGAGALNAAVLLEEVGAQVTLIARERKLSFDPSLEEEPERLKQRHALSAPAMQHLLPAALRRLTSLRQAQRSGDAALRGRGKAIRQMLGSHILAAEPADGGCERVRLTVSDGRGKSHQLLTSHVVLGTGYRFDKSRLQMLSQSLREQIRVSGTGALRLQRSLETSVPGLFFVGPLAAPSFGPRLQSLEGIPFASARVTERLRKLAERRAQDEALERNPGLLGRRQRVF